MVSGHTNGYMGGNSVLIIGNRTGIAIEVADRTGDKAKTVYDLDAGERTVKFKVQPSTIITSANSEVQESGAKDNLKIMVTLPKGIDEYKRQDKVCSSYGIPINCTEKQK